ncbi:MAG: SUMF1/EgtB/PvdO family nonheme iron enzyme [Alphaproteobacteria bacterium]|nr:SUMF1/EgtB/PvdO family nonheme iron enzyme [Alphaproteobacteria bacterium]
MAGEAIFIGYRRDDTADVAGRIYDAMTQRFGKQRVFKDVDNIGPGVDFGDYIKSVLPRCRVALVLVGPNWLESKDESGNRRLDDDHDWVRIEIETALATPGVLVVPVLVNGARMPRGEEVPESLKPLLRRNAAIIRRDPDFHDDVERLATALRSSVNTGILDLSKIGGKANAPASAAVKRKPPTSLLFGGVIAAVLVLAAIGFGMSRWSPPQGAETAGQQTPTAAPSPQDAASVETGAQPPPVQNPSTVPPEQNDGPLEQAGEAVDRAGRERSPTPGSVVPAMVRIPGRNFEVGRYEVTFGQWDACVAAGGCNGYRPSDVGEGRGNRPVINVSWNDAQAYVQWLSQRTGQRYRLPTSAEWEIAARAGATSNFSWGDQNPICDQSARNGANFSACPNNGIRPVGSFQPNAFGLYDMHGNVWEWLQDCQSVEPQGQACGYRGGSWRNDAEDLGFVSDFGSGRVIAGGLSGSSERRLAVTGFRVARTL